VGEVLVPEPLDPEPEPSEPDLDPLEPGPLLLTVGVAVYTVASLPWPPDPGPELPEPGPELLERESPEPLELDPEPLELEPEPLEPEPELPEPDPGPLDPEPEPELSRRPERDEERESSAPAFAGGRARWRIVVARVVERAAGVTAADTRSAEGFRTGDRAADLGGSAMRGASAPRIVACTGNASATAATPVAATLTSTGPEPRPSSVALPPAEATPAVAAASAESSPGIRRASSSRKEGGRTSAPRAALGM
jgi:hypothetical protein